LVYRILTGMKKFLLTVLFLSFTSIILLSQNDSCNAILVLKKGKSFRVRKYVMNIFSKKGFYLFQNYCYQLEFKDNRRILGRIIQISDENILITNSFDIATAKLENIVYDTLIYSINDIKTLQLITEDIGGYHRDINMDNYNLKVVKTDECCSEPIRTKLKNYPNRYTDCYLFLTNNGIAIICEMKGKIYIVHGLELKHPDHNP